MDYRRIKELLKNANFVFKLYVSSFAVPVVQFTPGHDFRTNFIIFKKVLKILLLSLAVFSFLNLTVFAGDLPEPVSMGLPFESTGKTTPENATKPVVAFIKEAIKYVGLLAILAISWGGIQFLVSYGTEEKVKKAKQTVTYALIGVVLSVFAYAIIDLVNSISFFSK